MDPPSLQTWVGGAIFFTPRGCGINDRTHSCYKQPFSFINTCLFFINGSFINGCFFNNIRLFIVYIVYLYETNYITIIITLVWVKKILLSWSWLRLELKLVTTGLTTWYILVYESKNCYKPPFITTIWYKATSDVYVVLCNAMALWHTIGLIWVVMGCYGRKSRFADELDFQLVYQPLLPYDSSLSKPVNHWPFISVTTVTDNEDWMNGYLISDKYRESFDNIVSRWHITPLPTFDNTEKFIKINDLELSLRGSLVLVYFELKHYAIRDKRTGCISTNTFSATATGVKILEHGADQSASPYKSLMLKGPRTHPQSPTKKKRSDKCR